MITSIGGGWAGFAQCANKQPFAFGEAWDEAIDGRVETFEQRTRDAPFGFCGDDQRLCTVFLHDPTYVFFVLFCIIGTRTIYKDASGVQTLPGISDYLPLQPPTFLHVLQTPLADGIRILAEHTLARARYVAEDNVKLRLRLAEITGVVVGDDAI